MKLIDRISLGRVLRMILDFIISIIKIFAPSKNSDPSDTINKPKWRRKRKND